jgi:hypothetical protein
MDKHRRAQDDRDRSPSMSHFAGMLDTILQALKDSLMTDLPSSPYRDFCLWALSPENPRREEWLSMTAASPIAKMIVVLLDELVEDHLWPRAAAYGARISLYFLYEVVSDDLALGLARQHRNDSSYGRRRELIRALNDAMLRRLTGPKESGARLLEPSRELAQSISGIEQNQVHEKYHEILSLYVSGYPAVEFRDLEHSLFPRLAANIDTCAAVAESVSASPLGPMVQEGLIARYRAVNALLEETDMTVSRRLSVGIDSVSVVPTLAYFMAMLAELNGEPGSFGRVLANGLLAQALRNAALIVRLLNDVGTSLLNHGDEERSALVEELRSLGSSGDPAGLLITLLRDRAQHHKLLLSRINKDIICGEFNVCLDGIDAAPSFGDALALLKYRLAYFADLYRTHMSMLKAQLASLTEQTEDARMSALALRFVDFHEKMYSRPHDHVGGEYRG